jgi:putative copper resistance protein D
MTPAWVEVAIRLAQFSFGLILFGLPAFAQYRGRAWREPEGAGIPVHGLLILSTLGLFLAALAAVLALTVNMYGSLADAFDVEAVCSVLTGLQVGMALGVRLILAAAFLLVLLLVPHRPVKQVMLLVIGGLIVAGFAWSGHGAATEGPWGLLHLGSDVLHLLAAAIWIGALVVLSCVIARASGPEDVALARDDLTSFSNLGTAAVLVIVVTGLINSAVLVGLDGISEMAIHPYGQILLAKVAMFAAMLGLAATNRFLLVLHLERQAAEPARALSGLKVSVGVETGLGFLVLLAVSVMGRIAPMTGG